MKAPDLSGQRFGRWTVMQRAENYRRNARWLCQCECGAEGVVLANDLKRGHSTSCGCAKLEVLAARSTRHGHAPHGKPSAEYRSWRSMMTRCTNPAAATYAYYGGRGVRVCSEWQDFKRFLADMGPRPAGTTLDRIDPNGNYEAANCRWADTHTQRVNRRVA